jgi:signal recognition particle receptor subunit beta
MNKYESVYLEDDSGEAYFGTPGKSRFEKEINKLAKKIVGL